jgi:Cu(I)/Ag(I) efflux system membrane fusion protein
VRRAGIVLLIMVAVVGGAFAGYWYGRAAPTLAPPPSEPPSQSTGENHSAHSERNVLYYRDPSGAPLWSATPSKDDNGRDYIPVYEDETPPAATKPAAQTSCDPKKILYYRNPMGLADTSPVPKKDSMGMDYIPVTDCDQQETGETVKISLERVQRSGVRIEKVQLRPVFRSVRAPGIVRINERKQSVVTLRAESYIEQLYVNATGETVAEGQPLFRVYSPPLVQAELEYVLAQKAARTGRDADQRALVEGAVQKLRSLGLPEVRIRELQGSGKVQRSIEWPSPASGTVLEKRVVEGQRVMAGEELYRIADLSTLWVIAEVAERDIGLITLGSPATVTFRAFPSQPIEARVGFVYPDLKSETRTARVRIEIPNPDSRLKPDMYADIVFRSQADDKPVLAVPDNAVIDSGTQQLVLVSKGEGRFEPREIKTGRRGEGYVEVLEGVKEGEEVVTSATFLIDAESNLRAALRGFTQHQHSQ